MDIVEAIKKVAAEKSIPIAEIGRRLEMSQQSMSQMLKPESIKFAMVVRIAEALEVGVSEILGEIQKSEPSKNIELEKMIMSQQRTIENLSKCILELNGKKP